MLPGPHARAGRMAQRAEKTWCFQLLCGLLLHYGEAFRLPYFVPSFDRLEEKGPASGRRWLLALG